MALLEHQSHPQMHRTFFAKDPKEPQQTTATFMKSCTDKGFFYPSLSPKMGKVSQQVLNKLNGGELRDFAQSLTEIAISSAAETSLDQGLPSIAMRTHSHQSGPAVAPPSTYF